MRGSPIHAQTRLGQTELGSGSPSPRCLTSCRVSPAFGFREFLWYSTRTLVSHQDLIPSLPELVHCPRQPAQCLLPRLDPSSNAHLYDVRRHVVRDTSPPTSCSPPFQFSKTSTRVAGDYRRAFGVAPVPSGGQPGSRHATRFDRLTMRSRDFLFPSTQTSTDHLTPRHRRAALSPRTIQPAPQRAAR
jgi:hypothetical protein